MICDNAPIQAWLNVQTGCVRLEWPPSPEPVEGEIALGGIAIGPKWEMVEAKKSGKMIAQGITIWRDGGHVPLDAASAVICAQEGAFGLTWIRNPALSTLGDRPCPPIPARVPVVCAGAELSAARHAADYTPGKIADACGVSAALYRRLERGEFGQIPAGPVEHACLKWASAIREKAVGWREIRITNPRPQKGELADPEILGPLRDWFRSHWPEWVDHVYVPESAPTPK